VIKAFLVDLRDLEQRQGTSESFAARLRRLRDAHASKRTLIERMNKAGLK